MSSFYNVVMAIDNWNVRTEQMPENYEERNEKWMGDDDYYNLASEIFEEEVQEIYDSQNPVELLDAFADTFYTLVGMVAKAGMTEEFVDAVAEVIRSNESKLRGKREYLPNGKLSKGSEYSPPDIESILVKNGWDI